MSDHKMAVEDPNGAEKGKKGKKKPPWEKYTGSILQSGNFLKAGRQIFHLFNFF